MTISSLVFSPAQSRQEGKFCCLTVTRKLAATFLLPALCCSLNTAYLNTSQPADGCVQHIVVTSTASNGYRGTCCDTKHRAVACSLRKAPTWGCWTWHCTYSAETVTVQREKCFILYYYTLQSTRLCWPFSSFFFLCLYF